MFAYAIVAIPIVALLLASARSFRGPAFFPIRVLAIMFIDVLRGVPLVLLILLLGFGMPAAPDLRASPSSAMFWGITALTMSYGAYTAEIIRSRHRVRCPRASGPRPAPSGSPSAQALRYAILPQALRNVVPAIMNTVVSLQKDVALVSVLGVREAVREAQIYHVPHVQLHVLRRGHRAVPGLLDPARPPRRPHQPARPRPPRTRWRV